MSNFNDSTSKGNNTIKLIGMLLVAVLAAFFGLNQNDPASSGIPKVEQELVDIQPAPSTPSTAPASDIKEPSEAIQEIDRADLAYQGKRLILTKHAKCRMDCRKIDATEVQEVLNRGKVNHRKSNPNDQPCPTLSLESYTHDDQKVRAVIADCEDVVKLITVIDLEHNYSCTCY